jgi:DNA replication protein DnaC
MAKLIGELAAEVKARIEPPMPTVDTIKQHLRCMASRGYIPSQEILPVVRDWLRGYGLLLHGLSGRGKTFFFQVHGIYICHVSRIMEFGIKGQAAWRDSTDHYDLVIDDLGAESVANEYGAKDDLLKSVITHRADNIRDRRTHITTNLDVAGIVARYGDRTMSRILGMCKAHRLTGEHRRKAVGG